MAEFHVLCQDSFEYFNKYSSGPWQNKVGEHMEVVMPFTCVHKQFNCDRYSDYEAGPVPQTEEMDFYSQMPVRIKPVFKKTGGN